MSISDEPMAPKPVLDTRGLPKPSPFDGEERSFSDCRFVFEIWAFLLDAKLSALMHNSVGSENPIPISTHPDEELRQRAFHVLVQLVKTQAFRVIRASPAGNGLEAWRLSVKAYEPVERGLAFGLLNSVLKPTFGAFEASTLNWRPMCVSRASDGD